MHWTYGQFSILHAIIARIDQLRKGRCEQMDFTEQTRSNFLDPIRRRWLEVAPAANNQLISLLLRPAQLLKQAFQIRMNRHDDGR